MSFKNYLTIALKLLHGNIHKLKTVFLCIFLGVSLISTLGIISNSIDESIKEQANTLLGGDLELTLTNAKASNEQKDFFNLYGNYSHVITMRAMARTENNQALIELKAVDENYPLIGNLTLQENEQLQLNNSNVYVEQAMLDLLEVNIGNNISIGSKDYKIADIVKSEPDRVVSAFSLGPRAMMAKQALENSGLLLPGSLIRNHYRIELFDKTKLEEFQKELNKRFPNKTFRIKTTTDGNSSLERFLERLKIFLILSALTTLLIGGIGIANGVNKFLEKQTHNIAILKTLGFQRKHIIICNLLILAMITFIACFFATIFAIIISQILSPFIANFFPIKQEVSFYPISILIAFSFGFFTVLAFSYPFIDKRSQANPSLLFRYATVEGANFLKKDLIKYSVFFLPLIALTIIISNDRVFAIGFILIVILTSALFLLISALVKKLCKIITKRFSKTKLALSNIYRIGNATNSIMLSLGISLSVLITLLCVEYNFQHRIEKTIPAKAPNFFIIDIQPNQVNQFEQTLNEFESVNEIYKMPMVRGRIAKINGEKIDINNVDQNSRWAIRGDRGISYSSKMPSNIEITEGSWWQEEQPGMMSLDQRLARGLGVKIGDIITLNIFGQEHDIKIANLRYVDYSTFKINFAMVLSPGVLEDYPKTYIANVYLDGKKQEAQIIKKLSKEFPNISTIRVSETISLIKQIIGQIGFALKILISITLLAGTLVLISALSANFQRKNYEHVILKVLGASKKKLIMQSVIEWSTIAFFTSLVAIIPALISAKLILLKLRAEDFFIPWNMLITIIITITIAMIIIGIIGNIKTFNTKALKILRNE